MLVHSVLGEAEDAIPGESPRAVELRKHFPARCNGWYCDQSVLLPQRFCRDCSAGEDWRYSDLHA